MSRQSVQELVARMMAIPPATNHEGTLPGYCDSPSSSLIVLMWKESTEVPDRCGERVREIGLTENTTG